jgi:hypothetical protein
MPTIGPGDFAPIIRIMLFVLGGWLANAGYDNSLVKLIQTDPQILSTAVLLFTAAWYAVAKILNWKR